MEYKDEARASLTHSTFNKYITVMFPFLRVAMLSLGSIAQTSKGAKQIPMLAEGKSLSATF
jgi:hypothetical protein